MSTKPPRKDEPVPNPDVTVGDEVYFQHKAGPQAAKVAATGRHGITVHHENKHHRVKWEHVLGHKKRVAQKYNVLDEGEDGLIVADEKGQRRYINVPPEARGEKMVLDKSFSDSGRIVFFAKAGPIANRPGLALQEVQHKDGTRGKHWVRTTKELPKVQPGSGQPEPKAVPKHVGFQNGEHKGHGKVIASGEHGHTVQDAAGGKHRVPHDAVTHEWHHDDAPDKSPHDDVPAGKGGDEEIHPDKFSAHDFAAQHDDPNATADSIVDGFGGDAKAKIEAAKARLGGVKQTIEEHHDGTKWSEERAAMHRQIMFDGVEIKGKKVPGLLAPDRIKAATPPPGQQPTFIALGGRGGSGKSSLNGKVYEEQNAIVLDADHIKGLIPEYAGWNAHQVHEESSHVLESVLEMAKILGVNVVLDATMKTGKSIIEKVDAFKNAGFRTEAHYMHLPRQEAAKRAVGRFLGGGESGRYVPPEVVLGNTGNEKNFDDIKGKVDAWSFHDNNRSKEEGPKLISQKGTPQLVSKKIMTKSIPCAKILLWRLK